MPSSFVHLSPPSLSVHHRRPESSCSPVPSPLKQSGASRPCGCINRPGYSRAEPARLPLFIPAAQPNINPEIKNKTHKPPYLDYERLIDVHLAKRGCLFFRVVTGMLGNRTPAGANWRISWAKKTWPTAPTARGMLHFNPNTSLFISPS